MDTPDTSGTPGHRFEAPYAESDEAIVPRLLSRPCATPSPTSPGSTRSPAP